ncbi:MAG: glycosyltransferase [Candidatus Berkelbacteria bacterium]
MKTKICMVTTSRLDVDSRIQNEAEALSRDFDVTVLCRKYDQPETLKDTPYKIKRIGYVKMWPFLCNILSSFYALNRAANQENPDFFHAHDLDGLLITAQVAKDKKKPLIYDSHELWSENLANKQLQSVKWIIPALEKSLIRYSQFGITASASYAEQLKKKYHRDFCVIRNMPKLDSLEQSNLDFHKMFPGETVLLHVGQTGAARGADKLIEMMTYLPVNFTLVFLGGKQLPAFDEQIEKLNLKDRVCFIDAIKPIELVSAIKTADIGLVVTESLSLSKYYSLPNKLMQYIAGEIPVLVSDIPEHRRIIDQEKIGEIAKNDPKDMAKLIEKMVKPENFSIYKANLKGLAEKSYNWETEGQKLIEFYQNLKF